MEGEKLQNADERDREIAAMRDRLSRLSEASLRINESLDFDTVLQGVLDSARSLTGARYGAVLHRGERAGNINVAEKEAGGSSRAKTRRRWSCSRPRRRWSSPTPAGTGTSTGSKAPMTLADAGYYSGTNLEDCAGKGQAVAVPDHHGDSLEIIRTTRTGSPTMRATTVSFVPRERCSPLSVSTYPPTLFSHDFD